MGEIEVGEYVRTNNGILGKLLRIERDDVDTSLKWYVLYNPNSPFVKGEVYINKPYIIKHSPNITDLIEEGDVIVLKDNRKYEVISIMNGFNEGTMEVKLSNNTIIYRNHLEDVKSILTKEQFSSMEYKV